MEQITHEFKIDKNLYFKWIQLVHAIPNHWKKKLTENTIKSQNISYLNHHLIKRNQIYSFEKLIANELYLILFFPEFELRPKLNLVYSGHPK